MWKTDARAELRTRPPLAPARPAIVRNPLRSNEGEARDESLVSLKSLGSVEVHIVVNVEAVRAVLDEPDDAADQLTLMCPSTPDRMGRAAPAP